MKTQISKKKSLIIIGSILIILCLAGVGLVYAINQNDRNSDGSSSEPSKEEKAEEAKQAADDKQNFLDKAESDTNKAAPEPVINEETLSFTVNQNDSSVIITAKIDGFSGEGTCSVTLSKPGESSVTKTAPILYQPEYSSCAGFSIDTSELNSGDWNVTLTTTSNSKSFTKSTTYRVQ